MDRAALKDLLYGGIEELTQNRKYYYNSTIGAHYNHWTEQGAQELTEFMNIMAAEIIKCRAKEDAERGKDMVMNELKKVN